LIIFIFCTKIVIDAFVYFLGTDRKKKAG